MSADAQLEALRRQVLQDTAPTAKLWTDLARATTLSPSFDDAIAKAVAVTVVYERAVRSLPYSYKVWTSYIAFRRDSTRPLCTPSEWFQAVRDVYERALEKLPRMPMLWVAYLEFVTDFPVLRATMTRHLLGRGLLALPATQHHLLWRVVKRWAARPAVPLATFRQLWGLYLQFDASATAKRQYLALLLQRGDTAEYVRECARFVAAVAAKAEPSAADVHLFQDIAFWEPLVEVFRTAGWMLQETATTATTLEELESLVAYGRRYCASWLSLELSYVGFLYGQGQILQARARVWRLLEEAADPATLAEVFRCGVEAEDQLVETFALSETARELLAADPALYATALREVFGSTDPCAALERLVAEYPMLVNQAQLRAHPRSVPLWLKRVELLQERVIAGTATTRDLAALLEQAISQCTAGLDTADAAAGQLLHCHALLLCESGRVADAAAALHRAAWHAPLSAAAANAALLGLHTEVRLLAGAPPTAIAAKLLATLGASVAGNTRVAEGPRRRRGALLASLGGSDDAAPEPPSSLLSGDARPWLLAVDLAAGDAALLEQTARAFGSSAAYTPEAAAHVAVTLWWRHGNSPAATREFELALSRFSADSVATLFLAHQYMAFLCLDAARAGAPLPLHRLRELFRVVDAAAAAAVAVAPATTLDLLVGCAFVECRCGLYGNAVRILQGAATTALDHLDPVAHAVLLCSVVEKAVECTQRFKGCLGTRQFCGALLRRLSDAPLLQRVALHWAAIERRCGNHTEAFAVLDACGDSQDPATPHGATYWKLWESLCSTIEEFEKVVRRKQQVGVRFHKRRANTAAAASMTAEA